MNEDFNKDIGSIEAYDREKFEISIVEGIVEVTVNCQAMDIHTAKRIANERMRLTKGMDYPLLCDISKSLGADDEARKFMATPAAMVGVSAVACLIQGEINELNFEIWKGYLPPGTVATRTFGSAERKKAIEWLLQYRKS